MMQPGFYLLGREDGQSGVLIVELRRRKSGKGLVACGANGSQGAFALQESGWWWRRIVLPDGVGSEPEQTPPVDRLEGLL